MYFLRSRRAVLCAGAWQPLSDQEDPVPAGSTEPQLWAGLERGDPAVRPTPSSVFIDNLITCRARLLSEPFCFWKLEIRSGSDHKWNACGGVEAQCWIRGLKGTCRALKLSYCLPVTDANREWLEFRLVFIGNVQSNGRAVPSLCICWFMNGSK